MTIQQYLDLIHKQVLLGNATEHTFRGFLSQLIEAIAPNIIVTNEPKRQKCGAPDYILTQKGIPIGYIEAKDLKDKDLAGAQKAGNKEQFDRYKASLHNLIFTDYLDFWFYLGGQFVTKIAIAQCTDKGIVPIPAHFATFTNLIQDFCIPKGQTIQSSRQLAGMMAGKARLLADVIEKALISDDESHENSTLQDQYLAFKDILIHDITHKAFSDVYAQTIAYGMFAARYHDPTLDTFSRQEAAELIPKSNPFLRKLFQYIAGFDLDDRIKWIVDNLVEIFLACNLGELLADFGKETQQEDPIIHFYETFLSEYDPLLRKARGVWYTPQPVVQFIVRAVDDLLKSEFNLPKGLADAAKTKVKVLQQGKKVEKELHRIQILDPATGTGTFLAEVVQQIYKKFKGQKGLWSGYVENHLLPRLHGFELLMASYAMAHLKLDILLGETGFKPTKTQRLGIYLTNSLEEHHPDTGTLFANWLSTEANEANHLKRDSPVMVVMGNPPYSVSSSNKGEWIEKLLFDYKKDLNERNIQPLSDDYIKFIRFGQHFVEKNGEGILAYISNNSFLDGIIHRQMRKHLLETFDTIYILDLHGNAKKKEVAADGSVDQNVFDIMQGVSINLFVKTGKPKKGLGKVFHYDLQGKRSEKYAFLLKNTLQSMEWNELQYTEPNFFFVQKDFSASGAYELGFKIDELFQLNSTGVKTHRDHFIIDIHKAVLSTRIKEFYDLTIPETKISTKFDLSNSGSFSLSAARQVSKFDNDKLILINYRPFDKRFIYYDNKLIERDRAKVMQHFLNGDNIGLLICRQIAIDKWEHIGITNCITDDSQVSNRTKERGYVFPLYLYPETKGQMTLGETGTRTPNLNLVIVESIAIKLGLKFVSEKEKGKTTFSPLDILDYIYAVLHSPTYRSTYQAFLKIDFPRVPYPKDAETFWQKVELGGQLRQVHLLESAIIEDYITEYPIDGSNKVEKIRANVVEVFNLDDVKDIFLNVYINENQYFANVPSIAWTFYIGGYQPAQKWLKDRKDRILDFEEILHYQKIIVALVETARLMREIDNWN
jgi:predicted helicase